MGIRVHTAQAGKSNYLGVRAQVGGEFRTETLAGRECIVVPVVALVEGVIQGAAANGPELALATEFAKHVQGWNGRPVVMNHPTTLVDGTTYFISANSPKVLEQYQFGTLFNSYSKENKLVTEAWIDVQRAETLNDGTRSVLAHLKKGDVIEVSTGLFTEVKPMKGMFSGKEYQGVWDNVVPDHLAFLADGQTGACSVADGCGAARTNSSPEVTVLRANCQCGCSGPDASPAQTTSSAAAPTSTTPPVALAAQPDDPINKGKGKKKKMAAYMRPQASDAYEAILANAMPDGMLDRDARNLLCDAIDESLGDEGLWAYIIGFTPRYVVYEVYNPVEGYSTTYQRSYTITGIKVTLGNDVKEVVLTTTITVVENLQANSAPDPSGTSPSAPNTETTMSGNTAAPGATGTPPAATQTPPANAAPAANSAPAATPPVAANTVDPSTLTVEQLEALLNAKKPPVAPAPAANAAPAPAAPAQLTQEQFLAMMPPAMRASMEHGMQMQANHRNKLVADIKATGRCNFTDAQLATFGIPELESLSRLAAVSDFSGVGGNPPVANQSADPQQNFQVNGQTFNVNDANAPVPPMPKLIVDNVKPAPSTQAA